MTQVLNKIRDVNPNDSDAVKDAVATFIQNLSKHTEVDSIRWLRVLENIVNRFPKFCGSHRIAIETYLTNFLDSSNYYNVIEAAKCAHVIQQIRPSQEKGATAKTCWREQMNTLCNAAHTLIDAIFVNTVNIYKNRGKKEDPKSKTNSPLSTALYGINNVAKTQNSNDINKKSLLCMRLRNIFVFLQAMLIEVYPVAKPIRPQLILEVIVQALSMSNGSNDKNSSDIAMIKIQALKTLDALIACLGSNLIPFSALVFRFVMQTLRWSSENPSEESRKVRCVAYSVLGQWLRAARGRGWEDEVTAHVLRDVTPHQHLMQLSMNAQPTKNLSKKAKRKLANSMLKESNIASHMPGEKNKISESKEISEEVAIAALECAETFLTVCGMFLKPTTHKLFQERLVRECYDIDSYSKERGMCLLRVLECSRKTTPFTTPPPTQYCLQLYSVLINSQQREISKFCSQALLDIRLHLHCSPPSLNFAVEVQPQKQTNEDRRKRISDRNRAVLESLLGAERMPSEDLYEEVISIPDEPSSKKPRVDEDIADKISVSSESVSSVEISDDSCVEESVEQQVLVVIEEVKGNAENSEEAETVIFEDRKGTIEEENQETPDQITDLNKETLIFEDRKGTIEDENQGTIEDENQGTPDHITDHNRETELDNSRRDDIENETNVFEVKTSENIFEARTQMPLNISNDTADGDNSPLSMEVAYDYPSTGKEKVTVLEKLDDENLPSTNDTDDIQITCGQVVKNSQDTDSDKNKDDKINEGATIVNGVDESPEKGVENGDVTDASEKVSSKIAPGNDGVTVEDMLADFVDEVNDENRTEA